MFSLFAFRHPTVQYDFTQVTTIESVVAAGAGRSRMIATSTGEGNTLQETELKNFFSFTGINFQNVRENDRIITQKISRMSDEGWELVDVTSGVSNPQGAAGIFITRYLYRRAK
ncbi:MAG: hypothetical protein H7Y12_02800 [Sphingobacteriaceae bacterium]|nr:hypothetical protein [Cytophagaceae bacterium]